MDRFVCIHGHFYQPPRENPWLEEIEVEDSAYPYHDWNDRVAAECYGPNAAARILDSDLEIIDIVNNYSKISFNFGPTLLYSLEKNQPDVYRAVLEADKISAQRFSGHGSAMAQVYNHMIMPLANRRDKLTQVLWGMEDFRKRFGREPEGMWLPETAVDAETLDILAGAGIKFTVLAPRQARRVKRPRDAGWADVTEKDLDTTAAYQCALASGRKIALFFYNAGVSQDVGFGGLLNNGEQFAARLLQLFPANSKTPMLASIATDGESYGHHHKHGDMALSYCLHLIESKNAAALTNYGEFLERHPPAGMAEVYENSSWSCVHGIERWRADCGCNSGMHGAWRQGWRKPLREAMDWLRDTLAQIYENEASKRLKDPWEARNDYISVVLDRSRDNVEEFLKRHAARALGADDKVAALKLLGMQRSAMLMYTSCGWFFDEISGIETVQVLNYAARAMQLAREITGKDPERGFLDMLQKAPSNLYGNGRKAYESFVAPARLDLPRVGAHHVISSLFQEEYSKKAGIFCYNAENEEYEKKEAGKLKLAVGVTGISSEITWEEARLAFAVLHLGDHNINAGLRKYEGPGQFASMRKDFFLSFERGDIPEIIRLMDKHFGAFNYSLWHIFKDEQRRIINQILLLTYEDIESSYRQIFDNNYPIMDFLRWLGMPLPKPLRATAEYVLNADLKKALNDDIQLDRIDPIIRKFRNLSIGIDSDTIGFVASRWVNLLMERLNGAPEDASLVERIRNLLRLLSPIPLKLNLWKAQNIYFFIGKRLYGEMKKRAREGDAGARAWVESYDDIGNYVHVKVS